MKKIKKILTKIGVAVSILILNFLMFFNTVTASTINDAHIYSIGDCGELLKYKGIVVKSNYVQYTKDNVSYPAYCLDKTKTGADNEGYSVSVQEAIQDVGLWRVIINGYPYKTIEELGVANKEEAFLATKQAIYCYIHENKLSDYEAIGEAGQRTLKAMEKIITAAENSTETKPSAKTWIKEESTKWEQDSIEKAYISKTYSVTAQATIQDYEIEVTQIPGIKIVDEKNNEKTKFESNEKFKVLIPIKEMKSEGKFTLKITTKVKTKPVLYGTAPNSSLQDYALTAATYEDGVGELEQQYPKNETEIDILKKDEETKKSLEGVEFLLLNENKEVIRQSLKTDEEGKIYIKNLLPGKYYLKESTTLNGYQKAEELIDLEVGLNEKLTVTVYNQKEKEPEIEIEKKETTKEIKKLPVTGM